MATRFSILVRRIPWMEEPDRLWGCMGSQRVRYIWSNLHTPVTDVLAQREKENYSVMITMSKPQTRPSQQSNKRKSTVGGSITWGKDFNPSMISNNLIFTTVLSKTKKAKWVIFPFNFQWKHWDWTMLLLFFQSTLTPILSLFLKTTLALYGKKSCPYGMKLIG